MHRTERIDTMATTPSRESRGDRIGSAGPGARASASIRAQKKGLPGPVPDDRHPDYVWPTWREALVDAFEGVERAYERRRQVTQAAYDAGLTFRQIADAVGMTPATVHKIIGRQRGRDSERILDSPAFGSGASDD